MRSALLTQVSDYMALTKPLIVGLLLLTALGGMFVSEGGVPPWGVVLVVMVGGTLAAGGANALNHYYDRDIDEVMRRTRQRPIPGHRVAPRQALVFGIVLSVLAFLWLALLANLLSAVLAVSASLFYIVVYTLWLKRTTVQNIVIGGAAGAVPPLVGWAAITGGLALPAYYLFAIIFFWTPPHFWALCLLLKDDYARAGVPMLPVVQGEKATAWNILLYSVLLLALTVLFATTGAVGLFYLGLAAVLGGVFVVYAVQLYRDPQRFRARRLYLYSLFYLALLFAAIMIDSVLGR